MSNWEILARIPAFCPVCGAGQDESCDFGAHAIAVRDERQKDVFAWALKCFGEVRTRSRRERAFRFLEESIELAQAEEVPLEKVLELVGYIYSRKQGVPAEELGGVGVTLLAYAEAAGLSAAECEKKEAERVLALDTNYCRQRHNRKIRDGVSLIEGEINHE